jgi:methylmalonyl-CoA epimerase
MKALRIDHVAIAVKDLAPVLDLLAVFGLGIESEEELPDEGVKSSMVAAGNTHIELIESTDPESNLAKFLGDRGPGLHHVCIEVDNLESAIEMLLARGMRLVDKEPRSDAAGRRVFLHPSSGQGVLMGIMERHVRQ